MIRSYITVITNDGKLESIHETDFIDRYRPTKDMLDKARELVKEKYPDFLLVSLHLEHYDKFGDNDKCNFVCL